MPAAEPPATPAYPAPLDAIVLAGTDSNPRRMIEGQNKAFLEIGGVPLVRRVVEALEAAAPIGNIYVVGPATRLREALAGSGESVTIVRQAGRMLANAWAAIETAEARFRERNGGRDDPQRPLLFVSSDVPLLQTAAVEDFVSRCAAAEATDGRIYGMLAGVAEEASLTPYYAADGRPGIQRPYVHLSGHRLRLANIYVGRPRTLSNQAFLQTGFEHRKAEKWKNVVALAWHFLSQPGGPQATWLTLRLQATLLAARNEGALYRRLRRGNTLARVERACGKVLGGGVKVVVTPWGGLSLDADSESDFHVLRARFEDWRQVGPVGP